MEPSFKVHTHKHAQKPYTHEYCAFMLKSVGKQIKLVIKNIWDEQDSHELY